MSLGRHYYLVCDGCSCQQAGSYSSAEEARRVAASSGWERAPAEESEAPGCLRRGDLCPRCGRARARGETPRQLALEEAV